MRIILLASSDISPRQLISVTAVIRDAPQTQPPKQPLQDSDPVYVLAERTRMAGSDSAATAGHAATPRPYGAPLLVGRAHQGHSGRPARRRRVSIRSGGVDFALPPIAADLYSAATFVACWSDRCATPIVPILNHVAPSRPEAAAEDHRGEETALPPRRMSALDRLRRFEWFRDYRLIIACLVVPLSFGLLKILHDRNVAIATAERRAEDVASIFEQHAHATFETYQLVGNLLAERVRGWSWAQLEQSDALREYLAGLVLTYPMIRSLTIIDPLGNVRASNFPRSMTIPDFAGRDYFGMLREKDIGTVIGQRVHSWMTPTDDLLNIARRRPTPDGSFNGVVVVSALPASFARFWEQVAPGEITMLYRDDGRLLARYPRPPGDITETHASPELRAAIRASERGTLTEASSADGGERLMKFRAVSGFPIFVVHGIDLEPALSEWRSGAFGDGVAFCAATAVLVSFAIAVIRHNRREVAISALLMARTRQLSVEVERRTEAEADLAAVLHSTLDRQEAERRRIARELHDSLGQHLAVLHLNVDHVLRDPTASEDIRARATQLKATATRVSLEANRLAWELRPLGLDDLGLQAALRALVETTSAQANIPIDLYIRDTDRRLPPDVEAALFRAAQEGLTNILKHALATSANVSLEADRHQVRLVIEDDGHGFAWDEDAAVRRTGRLGLLGMRERLSLLGGDLEIESTPGHGAALFISIPLHEEHA